MIKGFCFLLLLVCFSSSFAQQNGEKSFWGTLEAGPHTVGFRTFEGKNSKGEAILICVWYPGEGNGKHVKLKDYIQTGFANGKQDKIALRSDFKSTLELPILYNVGTISSADYDKLLATPVWAIENAPVKKGKWPAILIDSEPSSLCFTNEWFASHGFVVVVPTTNYSAPASDDLLYKQPTDVLEFAMDFLLKQSFVDTSHISSFGFGGGSLAPFFLSMRSNKIKMMADIDGGMFINETKTTLSKDYQPRRFSIPLLHITRKEVMLREDDKQFNAIASNSKYRLTVLPAGLEHYDFMSYGRIVVAGLNKRGTETKVASQAFKEAYDIILQFFRNYKIDDSAVKSVDLFKLEKF